MNPRLATFVLALLALAVGVATQLHGSQRPVLGRQSFATMAAMLLAYGVAGGLAFLSRRPERLQQVRSLLRDASFARPKSVDWRLACLLFGLAIGTFSFFSDRARSLNVAPVDDQADYLRVAQDIRNTCGIPGLPGALIRGEFREDNRHPLYVAILSALPTFEFGIGVSTFFGAATIVLCVIAVWRRAGNLAGSLVAILLASNQALHDSAALVACETLLCFLVAAAWFCLTGDNSNSAWRNLLAGVLLGLAYLTKASAFMLFGMVCVWTIWLYRRERTRAVRNLSLLCIGFGVAAGPLLVRNVRVYGNPLHSFNNKLLLADTFESGRDEPNLGWAGNWQRFRTRHTWPEILRDRVGYGLAMEAFVLLRSLGPFGWDSARAAAGAIYLPLIIVGLRIRHSSFGTSDAFRNRWLLLGSWTFLFWLFFACYLPIAASDRFVVPLVPIALVEAAIAIACLSAWSPTRQTCPQKSTPGE